MMCEKQFFPNSFNEVIGPFFDKIVCIETENCEIIGILQDYSSNKISFNGNIDFEASESIKITEDSSVSIGLNCSTAELVAESKSILNFKMQLDRGNLFINIGIE